MNSSLQKQITAIASFSENEIETIASCFEYEKFTAKEYLSSMGKISNKIFFIAEGLARVYYLKDGKEITTYLSCDDGFIASYSSFINQSVSFEDIQCIEDCEVLSITFEKCSFYITKFQIGNVSEEFSPSRTIFVWQIAS